MVAVDLESLLATCWPGRDALLAVDSDTSLAIFSPGGDALLAGDSVGSLAFGWAGREAGVGVDEMEALDELLLSRTEARFSISALKFSMSI